MHIPRAWAKVTAPGTFPNGKTIPVTVWGWGDDESSARSSGGDRLQRVLDRIRRGDPFPDDYGYGNRPLREEILEMVGGAAPYGPSAIVTRNGYGAQVLNAARLLFLDVDFSPPSLAQRLALLFGGVSEESKVLGRLSEGLKRYGLATFRIYRTASGFRAIAIDREFNPADRDVQELMQATGTDPAFARLCVAQRSFRARLTPKPWRCRLGTPPGQHPRVDSEMQQRFAAWLSDYQKASMRYATCRYLETVGSGSPKGEMGRLLEMHDRATRCNESLPLA